MFSDGNQNHYVREIVIQWMKLGPDTRKEPNDLEAHLKEEQEQPKGDSNKGSCIEYPVNLLEKYF